MSKKKSNRHKKKKVSITTKRPKSTNQNTIDDFRPPSDLNYKSWSESRKSKKSKGVKKRSLKNARVFKALTVNGKFRNDLKKSIEAATPKGAASKLATLLAKKEGLRTSRIILKEQNSNKAYGEYSIDKSRTKIPKKKSKKLQQDEEEAYMSDEF